jgi:hypothetical protein
MENLNQQKEDVKLTEKEQMKILARVLEVERRRFEYADTAQWMLDDKNNTDILLISERLTEWEGKAKAENKKTFTELQIALLRIANYCNQLETLNKASVSKYVSEVEKNNNLKSEMRVTELKLIQRIKELEKELSYAKKENEFGQSNK